MPSATTSLRSSPTSSRMRERFTHTYSYVRHSDLITISQSPTGRLDTLVYRAALIVFPRPTSSEWTMSYKSNICPTPEDAAFEIFYWLEEDLKGVFGGVAEGEGCGVVRRRDETVKRMSEGVQEGEALEKMQKVVQELETLPKKPVSKQVAQKDLLKSKHAPRVSQQDENEQDTSHRPHKAAKAGIGMGNPFRFEAGGRRTVPASIMASQSNDKSLMVGLKRKFGTGADLEKFKRARAFGPEGETKGSEAG